MVDKSDSDMVDKGNSDTDFDGICGARSDDGSICTHSAGFGTKHPGVGKCYVHARPAPLKDAELLRIVAQNPEIEKRATAYLNSDGELLSAKRELAVLKARFEQFAFDLEEGSDIHKLCKLAGTISKITKRIQDIEITRKHYIHIDVLTRFTADFSRIGQRFLPDSQTKLDFLNALDRSIQNEIAESNAQAVASRLMTKDAESVVVDAKEYESESESVGENEGEGEDGEEEEGEGE